MENASWWYFVVEAVWLFVVGIGWPAYATCKKGDPVELRGLNLPRGSVRAMLALVIVGSFVIFLVFMPFLSGDAEHIDKVLVAFGTLSGAVTGFYYGGRTGSTSPVPSETKTN